MAFGTFYTCEGQPRATAIKAVAKANGLDLNIVDVDLSKALPAELLKVNPLGKIPVFEGEDGFVLSEAIAIAIYLTSQNEKTTLLGKTKQDYALIVKWLSFFNQELNTQFASWYRPLVGKNPYNKKAVDDAEKGTQKCVDVLEKHLTANTYLVGERITLADLFGAGIITRGFQNFYGKEWRSKNPATSRWFETVVNQPIYSAVADKVELLDAPKLTNTPPKKTEAPKPKPAAAPAPAAEEEPAAPKPKHPCDLLPRATFPLDEYKRYYSNNDSPEALKYFWEKVPADEYSIWRVDYKYNDELTLTFMSNNLIGGFNARLEGSRKYLFGSASVYGENNDSVIQGAFVIRGEDHVAVFDVAPDWESYDFKKLDRNNADDRAFLENMWSWEKGVTVNGKEYAHADGKVFK